MTDLPDVAMALIEQSLELADYGRDDQALVSAAPEDYRDEYDKALDLLRRLS